MMPIGYWMMIVIDEMGVVVVLSSSPRKEAEQRGMVWRRERLGWLGVQKIMRP